MVSDRVQPSAPEIEQAVLGAMFLSKKAAVRAMNLLGTGSAFFGDRHRKIYRSMLSLYERGAEIDLPMVAERLDSQGLLEECGGTGYLADTAALVGTSANVEHHARILLEKQRRRELILEMTSILDGAYDEGVEFDYLATSMERYLAKLGPSSDINTVEHVKPSLEEAYNQIGVIEHGLLSPWARFNAMTGGLHDSELVVIGARPSVGKTAIALNILQHAAIHEKKRVALFSLEMSKVQIASRLFPIVSGVHTWEREQSDFNTAEWEAIDEAYRLISLSNMYVDDSSSLTARDIKLRSIQLKNASGLDMVIIDYLGLIKSSGVHREVRHQISETTKDLKAMAKDLDIPVVLLSQITRGSTNEGRAPRMSDLRESGSIEEDADVVLMLHRPSVAFEKGSDKWREHKNEAFLLIDKQRNGPTGMVSLYWNPGLMRFQNDEHGGMLRPGMEDEEGDSPFGNETAWDEIAPMKK